MHLTLLTIYLHNIREKAKNYFVDFTGMFSLNGFDGFLFCGERKGGGRRLQVS